jgi:hypothetical protein
VSYINREQVLSACKKLQTFYKGLSDYYKSNGINLESNIGRRNILMSGPMEHFLCEALKETGKYEDVLNDGRTGQPDLLIKISQQPEIELECKLTSPHSNKAIVFQTDFESLEKKGKLDYLYLIADKNFESFCAIHFENLDINDFRKLSPGARGKVQMYKYKGMKKAKVLIGKVLDLKEKRIDDLRKTTKDYEVKTKILINHLENKKSALSDSQVYDYNKFTNQIDDAYLRLKKKITKSQETINTVKNRNSRYSFILENLESKNEIS